MKMMLLAVFLVSSSGAAMVSAENAIDVKPDQVYGHKYGLAMTFDVFTPPKANGAAVLFINSGGYVSGQMRQCALREDSGWVFLPIHPAEPWMLPPLIVEQYSFEKLLAAGFTVFDVRCGSSPRFTIDEMAEDCRRAVRHIQFHAQSYGIDPARIGLWGGSAGGHLALLTAVRVVRGETGDRRIVGAFELNRFPAPELEAGGRVRAVAAYYPAGYDLVSDRSEFPEVFPLLPALSVSDSVLAAVSIKDYVSATSPPTLIIYGDQDFPFIPNASRKIAADLATTAVEVKTVVLPGVAHEFKGPQGYANAAPGRVAMNELVAWFKAKLLG